MITFDLHKTLRTDEPKMEISLQAEWREGKIIAISGKSGVGKTSLLRMLAGLMTPSHGNISVGNEVWFDSNEKINIKANKRNVGFLFQDYSLFPNMNVLKNIQYGVEDQQDQELVERIIDIADLKALLKRMPAMLSGGQQQRVALARAIVRKPKLLLLDEPLSALDPEMSRRLQDEILQVKNLIDTTIVLVSHQIPQIFKLADEVYLINNGTFTRNGTAPEVFAEDADIDTVGEVLSISEGNGKTTMKILINDQVVNVELPPKS